MIPKLLAALVFLTAAWAAPAPPARAGMVAGIAAAWPSVVSVLPDWPRGARARVEEPEGSGVSLGGGLIVTADHVIGPAKTVRVRLADGTVTAAEILLRDPETDIAVLKISQQIPSLEPAGDPVPGTPVCAIGNAFGLGLSVTCGVVSAVHRAGVGFNPIEDFVQSDTVVNPGASGGALIDAEGRLVGMLSAIFTKGTDADIGVNFAASAALVQAVAAKAETGTIDHVRLGVDLAVEPAPGQTGRPGLRVRRVAPGSLAAASGLAEGDLITAVDDVPVRAVEGLRGLLARGTGDARLSVWRDGDKREIGVNLP